MYKEFEVKKTKEERMKIQDRGITLVTLVITIIVILILAGVVISILTSDNGTINQANKAKNLSDDAYEIEQIQLIMFEEGLHQVDKVGKQLKHIVFNTFEDTVCIYDFQDGQTYSDGWYYITPDDVKTLDIDLINSYIVNYETGEIVRFDEERHKIMDNSLLCIKENLVYSVDAKNMSKGDNWGDAMLHNFNFDDKNSGWTENSLSFDGIDDGIEVSNKETDYSNGITIEMYFKFRGQTTKDQLVQILMMKRTNINNGFFVMLRNNSKPLGELLIDIGGASQRFSTQYVAPIDTPVYVQYTYDPNKEDEKGILYIDGEKNATTNLGKINNLVSVQSITNIQIGSDIHATNGAQYSYPFNGEIYATRVYNRALTEQELTYNYVNTVHE